MSTTEIEQREERAPCVDVHAPDPRVAGLAARLAALRAEVSSIGAEVASAGSELSVEDLLVATGAAQAVVNAAEGVVMVAAAHAASHEHRLTSRGLVEVRQGVGFIDAMAPTEVALATGTTIGVAGNRVQLGADLAHRFSRLLDAVLGGGVNAGTARKVVSACAGLDVAACGLVEAVLVDRLADLDPSRVTTVARRVAHRVAPGQAAAEAGRNRRGRCVEVSAGPDGTTTWWALLPAADSAVAWSAITTLAHDYQQADPALSVDQARADAMVDLLLQQVTVTANVTLGIPVVTTGGEDVDDRPVREAATVRDVEVDGPADLATDLVGVDETDEPSHEVDVVTVESVMDHESGEVVSLADLTPASRATLSTMSVPAERGGDALTETAPTSGGVAISGCAIPGIGWVEATTVAGICDTFPVTVGRALLDTKTGTLLETSTTAYRPTRAIREHVSTRDATCRMWGCPAPAHRVDLDHVRPWPAGATTASNLAGLCRRHHRMKQHGRWRYTLAPDGTITWTSPTGRKRVTHTEHTHWPPTPERQPQHAPESLRANRYPSLPPF